MTALPSGEARSIRNILLYYALLFGLGWALVEAWPLAETAFHLDRLRALAADDPLGRALGGAAPVGGIPSLQLLEGMGVAAVSMVGALILMVPVATTYMVIKRRTGYDESVVHTLLILPVAVAGIVIIVQNSTALAFSLTGIVAGVRFRTTLDDTKDAVYVFTAIGVGLAAGVQALGIAFMLSLVFIAINLTLWGLGYGNIHIDRTALLTLGDVLAGPGSAKDAVAFGDRRLLDVRTSEDVKDVAERVARMESLLQKASESKKERKAYAVLLIYTDRVGEAQQAVEPCLGELCIRWSRAEITQRTDGSDISILEYLVRPRDEVTEAVLMAAIRTAGGERVQAAEMRSLKALAKRL